MLMLKGSNHIRVSQHIKSFRSCERLLGLPTRQTDAERLYRNGLALTKRELRRTWLQKQWVGRLEHACRALRVLRPSARRASHDKG